MTLECSREFFTLLESFLEHVAEGGTWAFTGDTAGLVDFVYDHLSSQETEIIEFFMRRIHTLPTLSAKKQWARWVLTGLRKCSLVSDDEMSRGGLH